MTTMTRPTRTLAAVTLAGAALAPALTGCAAGRDWPPKYHATHTLVIPAAAHAVSIRAEAPFGDIDLAPHAHPAPPVRDAEGALPAAGPGEVALLAVVRSDREDRVHGATLDPSWDGDTLRLGVAWPGGTPRKNEGADWIVRVPALGSVTGNFDFGDLTITDPRGEIDLVADFGDIVVIEPLAPVTIHADFGDVTIERAHGPVTVESDFGDVTVDLTDANPGPLDIEADFGDVRVDAGPAFDGQVEMETDFGDARLTRAGVRAASVRSAGAITHALGDGPRSRITADFGDVSVNVRE